MVVVVYHTEHNHIPCEETAAAAKVRDVLASHVRSDPTRPIPAIYKSVAENYGHMFPGAFPSFTSVKNFMYNIRQESFPAIPRSREEVTLDGIWGETLTGKLLSCIKMLTC